MCLIAYSEETSQLSEQSVMTSLTDSVASGSHSSDGALPPQSMEPGNNLSNEAAEAALPKPKYR